MAEPEIEKKSDRADPTIAAIATKRTSHTWDTNGVTAPADILMPDALTKEATEPKPPDYLDDALKHAELLLKYAAEKGTDIATGNELAVKLRVQLGPWPAVTPPGAPPEINANDIITELQQFASTIRAIDARARQLNWLVYLVPDPVPDAFADIRGNSDEIHKKFQLSKGLPNPAEAASERTTVYQDVRYFAQNILDEVSFYYGATTACILPVLYALLGTCAYLLRSMKLHIRNQTYIPHYANSARFIIAAIGGAVVGLFNNFTVTQGATISPLAIAFLVGYAVDVFYAFLDGLLQTFIKNPPAPPLPPPAGKKP